MDNNIIPGMNISMSKNTESIDITKVSQHDYTIKHTYICLDILDLTNR